LTGPGSSSGSELSAKAEKATRSTPTSKPYAPGRGRAKDKSASREFIIVAIREKKLTSLRSSAAEARAAALGFSRAPAHFQLLEHSDGATTEAGKPSCAEPNAPSAVAGKSVVLALHVVTKISLPIPARFATRASSIQ